MGGSEDRFGPGRDTWEDRLGPDDERCLRTRVERWFRRNGRLVAAAAVLVVLGPVVALVRTHRLDDVVGWREPLPVVAVPPAVGLPPDLSGDLRLDREHPFAGSEQESWADGEAGVVAPAVEDWQARLVPVEQQVAALERVRQVVVAAHLDPRVLRGGDVEPLLGSFAVEQREELRARLASADGGRWRRTTCGTRCGTARCGWPRRRATTSTVRATAPTRLGSRRR